MLSPPRRHPGASRPGAQPASAALQTPSTRCSAAAASATSASVRLAHLCRSDRGHRIPGSGALLRPSAHPLTAFISAAVCAFSPTSRITQRDGRQGTDAPGSRDRTGRLHRDVHGRPAAGRNPGLPDDSGLASAFRPRIARVRRHPAGSPTIPGTRSPSPAASGRPPAGPPFTPLRRDPRSAPPPGGRSPCGRHDGRGRQRTTAIQEDPVGGRRVQGFAAPVTCLLATDGC